MYYTNYNNKNIIQLTLKYSKIYDKIKIYQTNYNIQNQLLRSCGALQRRLHVVKAIHPFRKERREIQDPMKSVSLQDYRERKPYLE